MKESEKKKIIEECDQFIKTPEGKEVLEYWKKNSSELMMVLCSDIKLFMDAMTKLGFTLHVGTNAESMNFEFTGNDGDINHKYEGKFSFKEKK